ncbi:hypothetical protein Leryth_022424 [Lithospermum erythrorhizon]|nr:hypothetical protein Leryth_022424 [Lithospermum erythrorhizon]
MQNNRNHHQASAMRASRPPNKRGKTPSQMEAPQEITVFKNRLLELAQTLGFAPPIFLTINEGSSYAPKFRITALVNGMPFTSKSQHSSTALAEQDASRVAYESIIGKEEKGSEEANEFQSLPSSSKPPNNRVEKPIPEEAPSMIECTSSIKQETERMLYESEKRKANVEGCHSLYQNPIFCKSILYEYAVKLKLKNPKYETNCKPTFPPRFISSVDFNGEEYRGEEAESKKQAEQLAAQAAITSLLDTLGSDSRSLVLIIKSKEIIFDTSPAPKPIYCVEHDQLLPSKAGQAPTPAQMPHSNKERSLVPIPSPRPLETGRGRPGPTFEQLTAIKKENLEQANIPVRQRAVIGFANAGPSDPRTGAKRKADTINWTQRKRK